MNEPIDRETLRQQWLNGSIDYAEYQARLAGKEPAAQPENGNGLPDQNDIPYEDWADWLAGTATGIPMFLL